MFFDSEPTIKNVFLQSGFNTTSQRWHVRMALNFNGEHSSFISKFHNNNIYVLCIKILFKEGGKFLTRYTSVIYHHGSQPLLMQGQLFPSHYYNNQVEQHSTERI